MAVTSIYRKIDVRGALPRDIQWVREKKGLRRGPPNGDWHTEQPKKSAALNGKKPARGCPPGAPVTGDNRNGIVRRFISMERQGDSHLSFGGDK